MIQRVVRVPAEPLLVRARAGGCPAGSRGSGTHRLRPLRALAAGGARRDAARPGAGGAGADAARPQGPTARRDRPSAHDDEIHVVARLSARSPFCAKAGDGRRHPDSNRIHRRDRQRLTAEGPSHNRGRQADAGDDSTPSVGSIRQTTSGVAAAPPDRRPSPIASAFPAWLAELLPPATLGERTRRREAHASGGRCWTTHVSPRAGTKTMTQTAPVPAAIAARLRWTGRLSRTESRGPWRGSMRIERLRSGRPRPRPSPTASHWTSG